MSQVICGRCESNGHYAWECSVKTISEIAQLKAERDALTVAVNDKHRDYCSALEQLHKQRWQAERAEAKVKELEYAATAPNPLALDLYAADKTIEDLELKLAELGQGPFVPQHQYDNICKQREEAFERARDAEAQVLNWKEAHDSKDRLLEAILEKLERTELERDKLEDKLGEIEDELV